MTRTAATVYVQYGEAETYWDASFNDDQRAYAGADDGEITGISVHVNVFTGQIELNPGYARFSQQEADEEALFATFKDAITAGILREVGRDERYRTFQAKAHADAERRREALEALTASIEACCGEDAV